MFNVSTNQSALAELSDNSPGIDEVFGEEAVYFSFYSGEGEDDSEYGAPSLEGLADEEDTTSLSEDACTGGLPRVSSKSPTRRRLVRANPSKASLIKGKSTVKPHLDTREVFEEERMSIYEKLEQFGILKKVTDIVMAKVSIPWHLREDAAQEIHTTWAELKAKPEFVKSQVARYAYMSGQHAALRLRRSIGAVVVIPGSIFRTGRDSSFMESIGAAVNPHNVEDLQELMELSFDNGLIEDSHISESFLNARLAPLTLTARQRAICLQVLVHKKDPLKVAKDLDILPGELERLVNQVVNQLARYDREREKKRAKASLKEGCLAPKSKIPAASKASLKKA